MKMELYLKGRKMKTGDIVTITDGSYTRSVVAGKLIHETLRYGNEEGKHYTVIATRCAFPLATGFCSQPEHYRNDTVIQDIKSSKVVFVFSGFLRLVDKPPREVTMTEVCAQFGEDVKIKK